MKNIIPLFIFISMVFFLGACSTSKPYAYDDIYYSPENDPIKSVEKKPTNNYKSPENHSNNYPNRYHEEGQHEDYPKAMYQNRYTQEEEAENNKPYNETENIQENNKQEEVYYDEEYASTINQINSPVRSISSYDPYTRDRIIYTADPFFVSPSLYGSYQFWDPYYSRSGISIGYNSWSGWNLGFSYGFGYGNYGYGYNPYRYHSGFYDPFYNPYRYRYSPWNRFGYGYGFGMSNYMSGYYHGFHNGFYHNYYGGGIGTGEESNNSNVRRINRPRGSSGSKTYQDRPSGSRTDRRSNAAPSAREKSNSQEKIGTREKRGQERNPTNKGLRNKIEENNSTREHSKRDVEQKENNRPERRTTPERYRTDKRVDDYSRPVPKSNRSQPDRVRPKSNSQAPSRSSRTPERNVREQNIQKSPSRNRPKYNKPSYNKPSYSRPSQPSQGRKRVSPQPQRQSRPRRDFQPQQRSRPSFNNTPSRSPSMGGSRSRSNSRPSRGSRPRR